MVENIESFGQWWHALMISNTVGMVLCNTPRASWSPATHPHRHDTLPWLHCSETVMHLSKLLIVKGKDCLRGTTSHNPSRAANI